MRTCRRRESAQATHKHIPDLDCTACGLTALLAAQLRLQPRSPRQRFKGNRPEVWCGVCAGVKAVSAAVALLEASVSHDAMHSTALRLVLSPGILPQIAQLPPHEVPLLAYPQQAAENVTHKSMPWKVLLHLRSAAISWGYHIH